jgi:hypothetical protein
MIPSSSSLCEEPDDEIGRPQKIKTFLQDMVNDILKEIPLVWQPPERLKKIDSRPVFWLTKLNERLLEMQFKKDELPSLTPQRRGWLLHTMSAGVREGLLNGIELTITTAGETEVVNLKFFPYDRRKLDPPSTINGAPVPTRDAAARLVGLFGGKVKNFEWDAGVGTIYIWYEKFSPFIHDKMSYTIPVQTQNLALEITLSRPGYQGCFKCGKIGKKNCSCPTYASAVAGQQKQRSNQKRRQRPSTKKKVPKKKKTKLVDSDRNHKGFPVAPEAESTDKDKEKLEQKELQNSKVDVIGDGYLEVTVPTPNLQGAVSPKGLTDTPGGKRSLRLTSQS